MENKEAAKNIKGNKSLNDLQEKLYKQGKDSRQNGIYRDLEDQEELANIDDKIQKSNSENERVALINERTQLRKNQAKIKLQAYKHGEYYFKEKAAATKAQAKIIEEHERAQEKKERTKIKAAENRQAHVDAARETVREKVNFIKENPKLIIGLAGGISIAYFAANHGTQILAEIVRHWYQTPTLAQETSIKPMKEKFLNFIFKNPSFENNFDEVFLKPLLAKRVTRLAESVKNTVVNSANFRNILFYGLPGTGKTMLAKKIARNSGLEYIYFAASSLDQFSLEEALRKLTELFKYAKKSSKKLMLIIDEAEILFSSRDHKLSEKTQKMLNLILTYTGTENNNYLVVALTNRPEDLDKAFLSRCGEKIEITPPNIEQRKKILKQYIDKFLINRGLPSGHKISLFSKLFCKPVIKTKLTIEPDLFTTETILNLAQKTKGFVGRDIMQFVLSIQAAGYSSVNAVITSELVKEILELHIEQKEKEANGFKNINAVGKT